jgi:hypothetical protein
MNHKFFHVQSNNVQSKKRFFFKNKILFFFQLILFNQEQNGLICLYFFFPIHCFSFQKQESIQQCKFLSTNSYDCLSFFSFFLQNDINYCGIKLVFYFQKKDNLILNFKKLEAFKNCFFYFSNGSIS